VAYLEGACTSCQCCLDTIGCGMSWYDWLTGSQENGHGFSAGLGTQGWNGQRPTSARSQAKHEPAERVLVRVYDLGTTLLTHPHNGISKRYGAFHTGVEVFGQEWSFGMSNDWRTGVHWCKPGKNTDHTFRETLAMGHTKVTREEFVKMITDMKREWTGPTYSLLTRNCHHFSDELCRRLGVAGLPAWVNDLAGVGHASASFIDTAYNSMSITDALYAVKSGMLLTIEGVPRCIMGRQRGETTPQDPFLDKEQGTAAAAQGPPVAYRDLSQGELYNMDPFRMRLHTYALKDMPPCHGDLVYPAEGEAVIVFHTMGNQPPISRESTEDGYEHDGVAAPNHPEHRDLM